MLPAAIRDVKKALELLDFDGSAAHGKMAPVPRFNRRPLNRAGQARLGGVLILLYCRNEELYLILTRRKEDLQSHAGQVSFPGGRNEAPESLKATALRETHEEIGVEPESLTILGRLSPLYIFPSDYEVHPFVAWFRNGNRPLFTPNDSEVAEIIEVPVRQLLDPTTRQEEMWTIRGIELTVPFFSVQGHKVWGATAMMLSEFIGRLRLLQRQENGEF